MKIAVTYEDGQVFQHFGRTSEFKVYDVEGDQIVSSQVMGTMGRGHGELIGVLMNFGVSVLLCGGIGGGARDGLMRSGIRVCSGNVGPADDVVAAFLKGDIGSCDQATCDHHGADHQCSCGKH